MSQYADQNPPQPPLPDPKKFTPTGIFPGSGFTGMEPPSGKRVPHPNGLEHRDAQIAQVHALYAAGLACDHSKVPLLMATVKDPPDFYSFVTALHALTQIADLDTIPVLKTNKGDLSAISVIKTEREALEDPEAKAYAEVKWAHLVANQAAQQIQRSGDRAQIRFQSFMKTLKMDATTLNRAAAEQGRQEQRVFDGRTGRYTYALREVAEMIYRTRDLALLQVAMQAGVNFRIDPGAQYKVQLAPRTKQERVNWIIDLLANRKVGKGDDFWLMQLAADEGKITSQAAAAKLAEMDKHRDKYLVPGHKPPSYPGYTALFRVIQDVGDKDQEPVIARYLNDPDGNIRYYANQIYPGVKKGLAWKSRIGY